MQYFLTPKPYQINVHITSLFCLNYNYKVIDCAISGHAGLQPLTIWILHVQTNQCVRHRLFGFGGGGLAESCTLHWGGGVAESCTLHNHCSYQVEPNSKDNSEYAVLCSVLRGSTDFFFWHSMGRR